MRSRGPLSHCIGLANLSLRLIIELSGKEQDVPYNIKPLPITDSIDRVEYWISCIALGIENSHAGRGLLEDSKTLTRIN